MAERAFAVGPIRGPNLSETERNSDDLKPLAEAESKRAESVRKVEGLVGFIRPVEVRLLSAALIEAKRPSSLSRSRLPRRRPPGPPRRRRGRSPSGCGRRRERAPDSSAASRRRSAPRSSRAGMRRPPPRRAASSAGELAQGIDELERVTAVGGAGEGHPRARHARLAPKGRGSRRAPPRSPIDASAAVNACPSRREDLLGRGGCNHVRVAKPRHAGHRPGVVGHRVDQREPIDLEATRRPSSRWAIAPPMSWPATARGSPRPAPSWKRDEPLGQLRNGRRSPA